MLLGRIELPCRRLSGACLSIRQLEALLVARTGFEPVISSLKGRRPSPSSPTRHEIQGHDCFEMPKSSGIGVLVAPDGLEPSLQAYETRVGTCRVAMNWWECVESNNLPFQERIYSPLLAPA